MAYLDEGVAWGASLNGKKTENLWDEAQGEEPRGLVERIEDGEFMGWSSRERSRGALLGEQLPSASVSVSRFDGGQRRWKEIGESGGAWSGRARGGCWLHAYSREVFLGERQRSNREDCPVLTNTGYPLFVYGLRTSKADNNLFDIWPSPTPCFASHLAQFRVVFNLLHMHEQTGTHNCYQILSYWTI